MPKVNVYLPDWLSEAVRSLDVPLSEVCQRALRQAVADRLPIQSLTPRTRRVLLAAADEARRRGHDYLGTEHLLLALVADRAGIAAQVLEELGGAEQLIARVNAILDSPGYRGSTNQVVGQDGRLIGYLTVDERGIATVVDEQGNPVRLDPSE